MAATRPLAMTGWRSDPAKVTTPMLGMTGWRGERDAPPPTIVCLGGQVDEHRCRWKCAEVCLLLLDGAYRASGVELSKHFPLHSRCSERAPPPKVACIGGAVQGGRCICAAGKTPKRAQYALSGNAVARIIY